MLRELLPFSDAPKLQLNPSAEDTKPDISKKFKIKTLGLGFNRGYPFLAKNQRQVSFEDSPYDFDRIIQAIDTDSYVKQAFSKYKDLFWKEGWDIVGENAEAVDYLYQRLDLFEEAMKCPINEFFVDVVDQLVKFSNVFIAKAYGDLDPYYRQAGANKALIGFYIIPTETVRIKRDRNNRPIAYQQALGGFEAAWNSDGTEPTWAADEVIHWSLDKKPGYAFGTPFIGAALDDVISLRQVEQDLLNLIHRELFPFYKYTVGTPEFPSTSEELDTAAAGMADLRVEGGIIIPERHDIEVVGAEGNALDVEHYLGHFKERVAIGLGVFPHHLGMATAGTNRSASDRLDVALYDRVKQIQQYIEERFRTDIFTPLLREGGFRPMTSPKSPGSSDRCFMRFREIDIDTQIKRENHIVNKYIQNAIGFSEMRAELSLSDEVVPEDMFMVKQTMLQTQSQLEIAKANAMLTPKPAPATGPNAGKAPKPVKPDAIPSSTGGVPNLPNNKKDLGNKVAPSNQFGRRFSPNVRRSDTINISEGLLDELVDLIDGDEIGE